MLARVERGRGHLRVQIARRGDEHSVDVALAEQFFVIAVGSWVISLGCTLRRVARGSVNVADGFDLDVGALDETLQMGVASFANTDHSKADRILLGLSGRRGGGSGHSL